MWPGRWSTVEQWHCSQLSLVCALVSKWHPSSSSWRRRWSQASVSICSLSHCGVWKYFLYSQSIPVFVCIQWGLIFLCGDQEHPGHGAGQTHCQHDLCCHHNHQFAFYHRFCYQRHSWYMTLGMLRYCSLYCSHWHSAWSLQVPACCAAGWCRRGAQVTSHHATDAEHWAYIWK